MKKRLAAVEARLAILEARVGGSVDLPPMTREEAARAAERYPGGVHPPGVVPPHVRANLDNLAAVMRSWLDQPERWAGTPQAFVTHLHALVTVAQAGGDVPPPPGLLVPR